MAINYNCKFKVSGRVIEIGETKVFGSGFQKREFVIECSKSEDYSNPLALVLKKDDVDKADALNVGDGVECDGFIEGRAWEKDGVTRYFTDLAVKSVVVTEKAAKPTTAANWTSLVALGAAYGEDEEKVKTRCKAYGKAFKEMAVEDWNNIAQCIVNDHSDKALPSADGAEGAESDPEELPF